MSDESKEIKEGIAANEAAIASIATSMATLQQSIITYQDTQRAEAKQSTADFDTRMQQLLSGLQNVQTQVQTNTSSQPSSSSSYQSNLSSSSSSSSSSSPQHVVSNNSFINTFDKQAGSKPIGQLSTQNPPMSLMKYLNNVKLTFSKCTGAKDLDDFIHNLAGASIEFSYPRRYWTTTKIAKIWQRRLAQGHTKSAADESDADPNTQITDQMEIWIDLESPVHADVRIKFWEKVLGHISDKAKKYCKQEGVVYGDVLHTLWLLVDRHKRVDTKSELDLMFSIITPKWVSGVHLRDYKAMLNERTTELNDMKIMGFNIPMNFFIRILVFRMRERDNHLYAPVISGVTRVLDEHKRNNTQAPNEELMNQLLVEADRLEPRKETSNAVTSDTPNGVCGYWWRNGRCNRIDEGCTYGHDDKNKGKGGKQGGNGKAKNKDKKKNNSGTKDRKAKNNTSGKQDPAKKKIKCGFCGIPNHNQKECRKKIAASKLAMLSGASQEGLRDTEIPTGNETQANFVEEVKDATEQDGYTEEEAEELRAMYDRVETLDSFRIEPSTSSTSGTRPPPSSEIGIIPSGPERKSKEFQKPASDQSLSTPLTEIPENEGTADVDQGGDDSWTAPENRPAVYCRGWRILKRF
jgi:hypothetical protein